MTKKKLVHRTIIKLLMTKIVKLPENLFLSSEDNCWNQMHSFVLVSQHHHHEYPSLDWFSTNLIVLQPDNDSKATLENYDTEQYHYQAKRIYYWQTYPSILLQSSSVMLPRN